MTINNIITDIESLLPSYAESNLISKNDLELHLTNELKRFGGNVMDVYPKVLTIKNGQSKLPHNFFSLYKAVKVEPNGFTCEDSCDLEELNFGATFYRVRKEASRVWDNLTGEFTNGEYLEVTEKLYMDSGEHVNLHFNKQQPLRLVRGFDRSKLNVACENIHVKNSPHEINIVNNTLQANFNKGFIAIFFQGLRVDEETDEIILPEDPNARIYEFLLYSGQAKVFEMLWANNDDPNVVNKLQYFNQKKELARGEAMTQAKLSSISDKNWWLGLKGKMRARTRVFENYG